MMMWYVLRILLSKTHIVSWNDLKVHRQPNLQAISDKFKKIIKLSEICQIDYGFQGN